MARLLEFITRHPLLVGGTLVVAIAVLLYELRLRQRAATAVSPQQAVRMINDGAIVVDLREAAAFVARHIANAINVSAAQFRADAESRLKKKRAAIVVCETGYHSSRFASELRKAGFENVFSLAGGLAGWEKENLPLVAGKSKS